MAAYFRDVQKREVMFLVDNIFRYVQAGSEVSGLLGRFPSFPDRELVPGDLIALEAGDSVPADARLTWSFEALTKPGWPYDSPGGFEVL